MQLFAEQETADSHVLCGRLDIEHVSKYLPCPDKLTYYVAGPPAMIQALTASLPSLGVLPSQIVVDAWE